jgi:uncharacterized protein YfaS (alpha-2-macroglobulin family)
MEHMMKSLLACSTLFFALILSGCEKPDEKQSTREDQMPAPVATAEPVKPANRESAQSWASHIESAPESWVSAIGPLQILFTHPVTGDQVPLQQPLEGVLSVEPQVETEVAFTSDRELSIRLVEALDRNVKYTFTLFPNKMSGIDNALQPYQFSVKPYLQDFGVRVDGLKIDSSDNAHSISGTVTTNDSDNFRSIENLLHASQEGKALAIEWSHNSDREHEFYIPGITRGQLASEVVISWDGKAIAVDKAGKLAVLIPAIASFDVLGAVARSGKDKFIEVNFSEPLDRGQSFKGLIKVQDEEVNNVRVDGNSLRIYPRENLSGEITVTVYEGIKSTGKARTRGKFTRSLTVLQEKPGVRFKDTAYILPNQSQITIPIEAVNVDSVQVTAFEMTAKNLGQFLQSRNMTTSYVDSSTTTPLWRKTFRLPEIPKDNWTRFDLDVTENFKDRTSDLLAFEVKINRSNIILDCGDRRPLPDDGLEDTNQWPFAENQTTPGWVSKYYHSRGQFVWRDRENPCKDTFYQYSGNEVGELRYFHSSNIGLIAKMAVDREMLIVATDIKSGQPLKDVAVAAYNAQHQPVARGKTDSEGMLNFTPPGAPFYLIAKQDENFGFLRLSRNESLSTNVFDTGGEQSSSGIKGFFYGERGVWRPGDNIYLTFIAHDKTGKFPKDYPLTLDLFDPRGIKYDSITHANPVSGFYSYQLKTSEDAPTGNWRAVIRYGGQYFSKVVPIETIKPNRLKIELEFPDTELVANAGRAIDLVLFSQWLNGATANRLKADVEMTISAMKTRMSGYDSYVFDDPARSLKASKRKIFEGKLDSEGRTRFSLRPEVRNAPGKLKLHFTTRVFENSGNFSIQYASIPYMPHEKLVGINVPRGSGWNDSISRDDVHQINFILLDDAGKPVADDSLDLQVYKIDWRWWWNSGRDNIASYVSSGHRNRLVDLHLKTDANGRASWKLDGKDYEWGRYLLRVCHAGGSHCSGKVVYLGWNYNQQKNPSGDTQLILSTDQDRYQVGDIARLTIPEIVTDKKNAAKLLLTIESGTRILSQAWIDDEISNNQLDIEITEEMAPNVYAHITLVQGYDNKDNDSPVRLYGIVPLLVDNQKNTLQPMLDLPGKVRPQSDLKVRVSEKSGRPMTYTLAIVDEGLLGITNYKTPDPGESLFKREALGVLTWDMYDLVSKSSPFNINRLLAIGGSDNEDDGESRKKKHRFPPIVKFIGPFSLEANSSAEHSVKLPDYIGAVRVMLVAGDQTQGSGAYGKAENLVKVTQPLTVLATLPRVLGPDESFKLPVNVFVNDESIEDVSLKVEANELFLARNSAATLSFDKPGDKIVNLDMKTIRAVGDGVVKVFASSGNEETSQTINIQVRTANLPQLVSDKAVLQPGESKKLSITPNGMLNTNTSYFEVSRVPQIDLESRMDFLLGYPHGCLEQVTSKLFPQIYLGNLMSLSDEQQNDIEYHVDEGMRKFANFQTSTGEFNYWPGGDYSNQWSNSYAGHFLIEARKLGYVVPASMYAKWLKAQRDKARETGNRNGYESTDAYTLYTLAIADAADFNAMNRLKEKLASGNSTASSYRVARWLLAAAYAQAGVQDAALELLGMRENIAHEYDWSGYTYGSKLRDGAILAMTYSRTRQQEKAWETAQSVADQLSKQRWHSTHSLAWSLMALGDYFDADANGDSHPLSWKINDGAEQRTQLLSPIYKQVLDNAAGEPVELVVNNDGDKPFYVLLGNKGIPENTREVARSQGVTITLDFTSMQGEAIDVGNIKQGEDFVARVTVAASDSDSRLENLALSMITPSGWEISNDRMKGLGLSNQLEYQDIRDDRVLSYFTLGNYYWWHRENKRKLAVEVTMNASYAGRFYLPSWHVESMYDDKIAANTLGQWVNVVPR